MVEKKAAVAAKTAPKKAPVAKKVDVVKKAAKVVKKASKGVKKDAPAKKEYKKKTPGKPIAGMKRQKPILSGKYVIPSTVKKPRTLRFADLDKSATPKDIREGLKYYLAHIKSVKMIMKRKINKKVIKDKEGKIIPQKTGAALVIFKTSEGRKKVQRQKILVKGRPVKISLAKPNQKHIHRMEKQAARKKEQKAKVIAAKKEVKEKMYKNLLKNQKKSGYQKREAAKKKSVNRVPKGNEKKKTVLRCFSSRQERRPLSGAKAAKARARLTRK